MSLIHMTVIAGLMILLILLIRYFALAKVPKVTFIALWLLVIARLLIPFEMPFGINLSKHFTNNPVVAQLKASPVTVNSSTNLTTETFIPINSYTNANMMLRIWVVGMAFMGLYFVANHVKFFRHINDSIPVEDERLLELVNKYQSKLKRKIQLRQSQKIVSLLTYGIVKPVILIPKAFDSDQLNQLEYAFAHEYIHVKRFDCLIKIIVAVVLCIHWFNPLVWVMYVLLNRDIELSCDEKVLELFGEKSISIYALTLIDFAEKQNKIIPVCSYFSKHSEIEERIKMMAVKSKKSWIGASLATLLVGGTMVAFASDTKDSPNLDTPVEYFSENDPNILIPWEENIYCDVETPSNYAFWHDEFGEILCYGTEDPLNVLHYGVETPSNYAPWYDEFGERDYSILAPWEEILHYGIEN